MMKYIFSFVCFLGLLLPSTSNCQNTKSNGVSKKLINSIEFGYLGYTSIRNSGSTSGIINSVGQFYPGIGFCINLQKDLDSKIALISSFSYNFNRINESSINTSFQESNSYTSTTKAKNWNFLNGMLGSKFTIALHESNKKTLAFISSGLVGISFMQSPMIKIEGQNNSNNKIFIEQSSAKSQNIAYQLGMGIQYNSIKRVNFGVSMDFFFTTSNANAVQSIAINNTSLEISNISISQKINLRTFKMFLGFKL